MTISQLELKNALLRTADWMEQNPQLTCVGTLATNERGESVPTKSPNAKCFCADGRLAFELGLNIYSSYSLLANELAKYDLNVADIYGVNDNRRGNSDRNIFGERQANPKVAPYLRDLAAGL